jgi:hypothetical protein
MKWIHNNYLSRSVSGVGDNTTFEPQTLHWKTCRGGSSLERPGRYSTSHIGTSHLGQIGCFGSVPLGRFWFMSDIAASSPEAALCSNHMWRSKSMPSNCLLPALRPVVVSSAFIQPPQKRTCALQPRMSALGQKRTPSLKSNARSTSPCLWETG